MKPELAYLLLASCTCLLGLAASAALLLRDQRHVKQRSARIDRVTSRYRISHSADTAGRGSLSLKLQGASLLGKIARMLDYDPGHRDIYPVRPIVVVAIALVPALVFARITTDFVGSAGWVTVPVGCGLGCRAFYGWFEQRLMNTLFRQFPDALAMIVRAVRVGLPIVEAIRVVARENPEPTAREFKAVVSQTAIGVPLDEALRDMAARNRLPEYRFFATALSLQSQTGSGLSETLENLADTIRKRVAAKLRGHALAAEARMSSYILGALPLVTGGLLSVMNPDYMAVLFTDVTGRKLLLAAVALLLTGGFIMRTMIRKSLS